MVDHDWIAGILYRMPNVISAEKRSVTFLESREVFAWMREVALERKCEVSVILREATSAYYLQHRNASEAPNLSQQRAAIKVAQRHETARQLEAGEITPAKAQRRNAPIKDSVRVLKLWPSIRRHVRSKSA